jgi:heat shock protein HtpX
MSQPLNVYDHIRQNDLRTLYLLILFPLSLVFLIFAACMGTGYLLKDPDFMATGIGMLNSVFPALHVTAHGAHEAYFWGSVGFTLYTVVPIFILTSVWMFISYLFGDLMMLKFARAERALAQKDLKVFQAVENVAIMAGLPVPKVYIIEEDAMNAFATGRAPKSASIALTRGLIDALAPDELEAVIAHEMAHIQSRDIRLNMLIVTGLGVFGLLAGFLRHYSFYMPDDYSKKKSQPQLMLLIMLILTALLVFHLLIAPLIRRSISITREYAADAGGALIVRNPMALAAALAKIAQNSQVHSIDKEKDMAAVFIANPLKTPGLEKASATHHTIFSRIKRLEAM